MTVHDVFRKIAKRISEIAGSSYAFTIALVVIITWALLGSRFNYSDTWQLVINTGTTILTFLMVFLIQNMQNRESKATQLKLDELVRAIKGARDGFVDIENMSDKELDGMQKEFEQLKKRVDTQIERRKSSN